MPILRVIGLIIALVAIRAFAPDVFTQGQDIIISLLTIVTKGLSIASQGIDSVASTGMAI